VIKVIFIWKLGLHLELFITLARFCVRDCSGNPFCTLRKKIGTESPPGRPNPILWNAKWAGSIYTLLKQFRNKSPESIE